MNAAKAVRALGLVFVVAAAVFAQAPQGAAPPAAAPAQGPGGAQGAVGEAPAGFARPNPDTSGPAGTWYIDANDVRATVVIAVGADGKSFTGTLTDAAGSSTPVDNITWDAAVRRIEFRTRDSNGAWYWCRATIVEGVMAGRFAKNEQSSDKPAHIEDYTFHVTGWNRTYLDHGLAPRVYDLLLDNEAHATLRIDVSEDSPSGFAGRFKIYATEKDGAAGEQVEFDVAITHWDGTNLSFVRTEPLETQTFTGTASGATISGNYADTSRPGTFSWSGARNQVLGYGFSMGKTDEERAAWQARFRKQLYLLMMGGNPAPLTSKVTVLAADLPPIASTHMSADRDDNPAKWPQNYKMSELQFDSTLPNPYGGAPMERRAHGYLAVPTTPPPAGGKYPVVIAVNGHGGSAWRTMNPDGTWYGDAFARRGYVVLALDISHRPLADRQAPYMSKPLYSDRVDGEDPAHGNGPHPSIKAAGFDSDWEEDGERVWDAMRAVDYILSLPNVDSSRVIVVGHSMGGEEAALIGALEPRISLSIPASFSPDLGVLYYHGNHPCWRWMNANIREYVDASDFFALTAPRPLIVETGQADPTYSKFPEPFASDMEVLRRTRVAYGGEVGNVIHYMHYDQHRFHVGDVNPTQPTEWGIRVPESIAPTAPDSIDWQVDPRRFATRATLFDAIDYYLDMK
jgi:dienelactone hydrolase